VNILKGQFNIEYLFSLVIFISVVVYLSIQVVNAIPQYHQRSIEDRLYSDSFRITELLIKDSKIGFAVEPYKLNSTKMKEFNGSCISNYEKIKEEFDLENTRDFQLTVFVNSSFKISCGLSGIPSRNSSVTLINIDRYASTDNQPTKINFKLW